MKSTSPQRARTCHAEAEARVCRPAGLLPALAQGTARPIGLSGSGLSRCSVFGYEHLAPASGTRFWYYRAFKALHLPLPTNHGPDPMPALLLSTVRVRGGSSSVSTDLRGRLLCGQLEPQGRVKCNYWGLAYAMCLARRTVANKLVLHRLKTTSQTRIWKPQLAQDSRNRIIQLQLNHTPVMSRELSAGGSY